MTIYGSRIHWNESASCPGRLQAEAETVRPRKPDAAAAALAEGFCPDCLVPLGGNPCIWCPRCRVFWHFPHRPRTPGASDDTTAQVNRLS